MRVFIGFVLFLCVTIFVSLADGEEAGVLSVNKNIRERNGRYDVTELRELAAKSQWKKYPFVLYEDGIFKMWYGGTTVVEGKRDFQIGYATSRDGTHFARKGKISHYARGNMGDKPGCDIRVAVFEGNLNELASAEPRAQAGSARCEIASMLAVRVPLGDSEHLL